MNLGEPFPPGKANSPHKLDRFTAARLEQPLCDFEETLIHRDRAPSWLLYLGPTRPGPGAVRFKRIPNCGSIFQPQHDIVEFLIGSVRFLRLQ